MVCVVFPGEDPGILKGVGGGPAEFSSKGGGGGGESNHLLGSNLYCKYKYVNKIFSKRGRGRGALDLPLFSVYKVDTV